ncbi:MAG: hypothetical protein V1821_02930 [bacterium]
MPTPLRALTPKEKKDDPELWLRFFQHEHPALWGLCSELLERFGKPGSFRAILTVALAPFYNNSCVEEAFTVKIGATVVGELRWRLAFFEGQPIAKLLDCFRFSEIRERDLASRRYDILSWKQSECFLGTPKEGRTIHVAHLLYLLIFLAEHLAREEQKRVD